MNKEDFLYWKNWCSEKHDDVNQLYGKVHPYSFHLNAVHSQVLNFKHLIRDKELVIAEVASWGHDLLEDTNKTYNDLKEYMGGNNLRYIQNSVAEVIYCVTDEKGRNRKERKNEKYYKELVENEIALYVKLCDLIANTMYSRLTASSMYSLYKKEYPDFKEKTYNERFSEMYSYLESL